MSTQADRSVRAILASLTPNWLWTWNGVCFGYRRGDSLFTYDGVEAGRFSGAEIYGADGSYLGEVQSSEEDGDRLVTSSYKKFHTADVFEPTLDRPHAKAPDRMALPLYCGYEHFPSPELVKGVVVDLEAIQRMFANADRIR